MYAWTSINAEDEAVAARYRDKEEGMDAAAPPLGYDPSYSSDISRSPPAAANYSSYYSEPPKKKVDAIAEAWGMHEPEPYEEFFAGGGDHDGPITNSSSMREGRSNGRANSRRPRLSPTCFQSYPSPQPIFAGDFVGEAQEPEGYSPPAPHPVLAGLTSAAISLSYRVFVECAILPMYLSALMRQWMLLLMVSPLSTPLSGVAMDSQLMVMILGRFARGGRRDMSPAGPVDPYAYASDDRVKELPATPTSPYYDAPTSPGGGLGRKTSILKKVRGVVYRGSK